MLNFLEQKNRKQIVCEYMLRVAIYFLAFTFIISLILIAFFMPSVFFVKYKYETVETQLESINQTKLNKADDPIVLIKNINRFSAIFSKDSETNKTYNKIINKIISLKNKDIKILYINIEKNTKNTQIIISGIANTRDSLTLFNTNLKTDGFFSTVVFPVSNFIKSTDSEFNATLTL